MNIMDLIINFLILIMILGDLEVDLKQWCIFYGLWIASGFVNENKEGVGYYIRFNAHKKRVKKALTICCKEFDIKISKTNDRPTDKKNIWCINDKEFVKHFRKVNAISINKKIAKWCFELPARYANYLIDGLVLGNGEYMKGTTTRRYYTSSVQLKDDVQRLGIHASMAVEAKKRKGMEEGAEQVIEGLISHLNAQAWMLTLVNTQVQPKVNKNATKGDQQDKMVNYDGKVYCCTVGSSIIYVERNGLVMWSGNSRNAQKGTCGILYKQEDMPFTLCFDANGELTQTIIPDFIINPNAIPSRMTIAQIIEGMAGKYAARKGIRIDGTPFCEIGIEQLGDLLEECGFNRYGDHVMINGQTGKEFMVTVFIAPTFYQRLKHLVFDKIHSRSVGPRQGLTRQPTEGRARDGGFRLGEMERDSCIAGTLVNLYNGLRIKIEDMEKCGFDVLSWERKIEQVVISRQTNFLDRGMRESLQITLEDGTIIKTGLKHPHLNNENKWIQTKHLKVGDILQNNLKGPVLNIKKEMDLLNPKIYNLKTKTCNVEHFELKLENYTFDAKTEHNYMKLLAFCRLLGLIVTDGVIPKAGNIYISCDSLFDAEVVKKDIELVINANVICHKQNNQVYYTIALPTSLSDSIKKMECMPIGTVTQTFLSIPLIDHWPKPCIREFLGGFFGGDGVSPSLALHRGKRDEVKSVEFLKTKKQSYAVGLKSMMIRIKNMLAMFDITNVNIQEPKGTTDSCEILLQINVKDMIKFSEQIGFRYCAHKAMRLAAAVSYRQLRENTFRQTKWVVDKVKELTGYVKGNKLLMSIPNAVLIAHAELKNREPIYNEYYSLPSYDQVRDRLKTPRNNLDLVKMNFKKFPTPEEYFEKIGCLDWFLTEDQIEHEKQLKLNKEKLNIKTMITGLALSVQHEDNGLPTFNLKIIDIKNIGSHQSYDIEVINTESYIANGVVTHNCLITHGIAQFLKEIMLEKSDIYATYVCDICGLFAQRILDREVWYCPACPSQTNMNGRNNTRISKVVIPYTFKLLVQELMALHLAVRIEPRKTLFNQGIM
jgi:intein/homing endonuclease/ribosomal protein L37AE/L43A